MISTVSDTLSIDSFPGGYSNYVYEMQMNLPACPGLPCEDNFSKQDKQTRKGLEDCSGNNHLLLEQEPQTTFPHFRQ